MFFLGYFVVVMLHLVIKDKFTVNDDLTILLYINNINENKYFKL